MDEFGKPQANDIQTLTSLWHQQSGTHGGWWALAGFSFQSAIYLLRFFEGLRERRDEPSKLAETEKLSDIFKPENGAYRLIQVKRTLRPDALKSALREAYRTAQLCTAELLDTLVFQIACLHRETPKRLWDVRMDEVIQGDGDLELWGRMLSRFHASDPIIVEPDPLDHLHYLLWEAGVQDTQSFVTRCLGELLEVFVVPSEDEIARLARRLASQFYTVLPSKPPPVIGTQLKAVDFARRAEANSDQDVVVAVRPTLRDFQMGRFRERPDVFSALRQAFEGWWDKLKVEESRAVPVFWIDGRSGEGKSVLLLQLVQHVLSGTAPPVVVRLSPDELPAWVARQRQRQRQHRLNHEGWQPIIAVIDDLHTVGDMEEWTQQLRSATDLEFPGIAVIACGPTPERQELERVCRPLLDVKHFTMPNLDAAEMDAFRKWYVDRTGKDVSLDASDPANRLLVIWMFELAQGRSLHDFAQNFRQRLVRHDLLDLAKVILAANAVELPAPSRLIAELHHEKRDRFGTLCRAGQLHFEETTQTVTTLKMDHSTFIGYRLAHLQIAWRLYCEWPRGYASLAAIWARDLAEGVAAAMRQGDTD